MHQSLMQSTLLKSLSKLAIKVLENCIRKYFSHPFKLIIKITCVFIIKSNDIKNISKLLENVFFLTFLKVESILLRPLPATDAFGPPPLTDPAELRLAADLGSNK